MYMYPPPYHAHAHICCTSCCRCAACLRKWPRAIWRRHSSATTRCSIRWPAVVAGRMRRCSLLTCAAQGESVRLKIPSQRMQLGSLDAVTPCNSTHAHGNTCVFLFAMCMGVVTLVSHICKHSGTKQDFTREFTGIHPSSSPPPVASLSGQRSALVSAPSTRCSACLLAPPAQQPVTQSLRLCVHGALQPIVAAALTLTWQYLCCNTLAN